MPSLEDSEHAYSPLLTPQWTHLPSLPSPSSSASEWEEDEVSYLTLDFGAQVKPDAYKVITDFQLLGINNPTPYARVGTQFFKGQHEELIGSEILLEHQDNREPAYQPLSTASSRITFQPVSITERVEGEEPLDIHGKGGKGKGKGKVKVKAVGGEGEPVKRGRGRPKGSKTGMGRGTKPGRGRGRGRGAAMVDLVAQAQAGGSGSGSGEVRMDEG